MSPGNLMLPAGITNVVLVKLWNLIAPIVVSIQSLGSVMTVLMKIELSWARIAKLTSPLAVRLLLTKVLLLFESLPTSIAWPRVLITLIALPVMLLSDEAFKKMPRFLVSFALILMVLSSRRLR